MEVSYAELRTTATGAEARATTTMEANDHHHRTTPSTGAADRASNVFCLDRDNQLCPNPRSPARLLPPGLYPNFSRQTASKIMKTRGLYHRCRGMLCMTNNDQGCMPPIYSNMALLYKNGLIITQAFICKKKWLIHFKYLSLNHGVDLLESIQSDPKKDSTKN
ncbi:hypothetical protein U9M48_022384 [Paspalum notatum var. saurae]|uniref:Uncharacterized protein n=1 Tax=Paspalum notatum var. saurae TaxID=547442 RepID=A0AAQ3TLS2_PASNO